MYKILIFLCLLFSINTAKSQAYLIYPETNISVKKASKQYLQKEISNSDTIKLPFFDDFSSLGVYPNSSLWIDKYAYINQGLAVNPPSIGVATLDAINSDGSIYENANIYNFIADKLTSKPIDLDVPSPMDTSIYLSFFYQPQGIADSPEYSDSLILEFYSPIDSVWNSVWTAFGSKIQPFKQIIIQIKDDRYLQKGFQFRFKNYASLSENADYPGRRGNCDFWHLDWIYLNSNRNINDTILNDLAFVKPLKSLLQNYESVPWTHFFADTTTLFKSTNISVNFKNHFAEEKDFRIIHKIIDPKNSSFSHIYDAGFTLGIGADSVGTNEYNIKYNPFKFSYGDSAKFIIQSYISDSSIVDNLTSKFRLNDTLTYHQNFYNYYAYDDGSAEAGFGMDGNQTEGAKAALQFNAFKKDTLQAVEIYFNQTYKNASKVNFILTIWDDLYKTPIYESKEVLPVYEDSLNQYHIFEIDTTLIISGKFYVGWQQIEPEFLNIGFDLTNDASTKLLYNIYGSWQFFPTPGSLMIRPVFGKPFEIPAKVEKIYDENDITLYPNPTNTNINIVSTNNFRISTIEIFDVYGRKILESHETKNIDVSNFAKGVYFVRVSNQNNNISIKKFVVN